MELIDYNFKDNPFRIGPAISPDEIIWAGFAELKDTIQKRIEFSVKTSPSRIVLNWGRYGSGKTHAANYFTKTSAVDDITKNIGTTKCKSTKITLPRTSKDPVQAFFRSFLGQIGLNAIKTDLEELKKLVPVEFDSLIDSISSDSIIRDLFYLIVDHASDKMEDIELYLFGDITKTTLSKLNLPFGIKDDEQIVNFISSYFNLITYRKILYSSFILWIDEFEDIDSLNKSSQDRFTTFLRQLFDTTANNFLLFLNFTPKTFYNIEDLSLTLGEALSTRAKTRIEFDIPSIEVAKNYIIELISNPLYRDKSEGELAPFSDESVSYILEHIGTLSVRKINEVFSLILEMGLIYSQKILDIEFIIKIKPEIISWEE